MNHEGATKIHPMRKVMIALLLGLMTLVVPSIAHADTDEPTILVGVTGLSWPEVSEENAPTITRFASSGSIAAMSVKTVGPTTCVAAGWLTLGSGERASSCEEPAVTQGRVSDWATYLREAEENPYTPELGRLGDQLSVVALGPNAALAAADSQGRVQTITSIDEGAGADLIVVDLGSVGPESGHGGASAISGGDPISSFFKAPELDQQAINADVARIDKNFAGLLEQIQEAYGTPRIILASVADYSTSTTGLQVLATNTPGVISSLTTRSAGLVHLTDLTATLATNREGMEGNALTWGNGSSHVSGLVTLTDHVDAVRPAVGPVMAAWAATWFLALIFAARGKPSRFALLSLGAVPAASIGANLLPWFATEHSTLALLGLTAIIAAGLGFIAHQAGGVMTIAGANLAMIGLGMLVPQAALYTIIGSLPHTGRYYGMNNMLFAITAVNAILLICALFRNLARRTATIASVLLALLVIGVDGMPGLGTDFGGPPVLVLGLGLLILGLASWSWARAALLLPLAVLVPALFVVVDMGRDNPTHIGAFGQAVADGSAWGVVSRKAGAVLAQWPFLIALAILVVAGIYAWKRWGTSVTDLKDRYPQWFWAVLAALIILGGGSFINDSGIAILAMGIAAGLPLAVAMHHEHAHLPSRR